MHEHEQEDVFNQELYWSCDVFDGISNNYFLSTIHFPFNFLKKLENEWKKKLIGKIAIKRRQEISYSFSFFINFSLPNGRKQRKVNKEKENEKFPIII